MSTPRQYTYSRGTEGCDNTFDIYDPRGELLTSIHYWEREAGAEADARLIVHRMNCHTKLVDAAKRTLRQFELILEMDDPQAVTQTDWEAEPLASLREAIAEAEGV